MNEINEINESDIILIALAALLIINFIGNLLLALIWVFKRKQTASGGKLERRLDVKYPKDKTALMDLEDRQEQLRGLYSILDREGAAVLINEVLLLDARNGWIKEEKQSCKAGQS